MAAVRRFRADDQDACRALWVELTECHRELYGDPAIGGDDPGAGFDGHLAEVGEENVWVAEDAGRVVGLAGLIPRGRRAELEPVVVSAAYRGRGVGGALVSAVVEAARARQVRQVVVRPTGRNAEAVRFLHHVGFDAVARLELALDLGPGPRWADRGERFAGLPFRT